MLNDSDPNRYHPKWAVLTIPWVFTTFMIHILKFFFELATTRKSFWFKLFIHVQFVQPPLRNLYLARTRCWIMIIASTAAAATVRD